MSDNRDLSTARQALDDIQLQRERTSAFQPALEIESNLMGLLRFRIDRIREDADFEDRLKEAMLDRLPEATFSEMIAALNLIKQDQNESVQRILAPFIARSDRVPLLDAERNREKITGDDALAGEASKDVLQGLGELTKAITALKRIETSSGSGASTADEESEK